MPQNYFVNVRLVTKQKLLAFLNKHSENTVKKNLGLFSLRTGYKISTLEVYVKELQDAELISE